jgi:regulator of RNase E activity RraA
MLAVDLESLRARFEALYSGVVYDAMYHDIGYRQPFVVDRGIKPLLWSDMQIFGPAFTCKGVPVDDDKSVNEAVRLTMFQEFTHGCIQVIDTGHDDTVAHFGDISGRIATKFGCRGAVVDGYTRDAQLLIKDGFPLFCRGTQPIDAYGHWQIIEYQTDITLAANGAHIIVSPNDYVFGDADGVLIIPEPMVTTVCSLAEQRLATEQLVREKLNYYTDIQSLNDEVGRW